MKGIYQYRDLETNEVVYIGKDRHIDENKRHKDHFYPSKYNDQQINRILQNNPDRYQYEELCASNDCDDELLNELEMGYIETYNPKFNFTHGGDGKYGFKPSSETCKKISNSKKGEKHPFYGKHLSDEHKQKISDSLKKINNQGDGTRYWKGKQMSDAHKQKISESMTLPYARIVKQGFELNKQRYGIRFNGKIIKKSIDKQKLIGWFKKNYLNEELKT
jgi:group I intron endonuclease